MHIGTNMIFGGILEGVWPINNPNKFLLCDFRCQSKSRITGFFKHLHYSVYKPSQDGGRCVMSDSPLYNITCALSD